MHSLPILLLLMLVLHVVEHKRVFYAKTHNFFAKNVKNVQNINLCTVKQVFVAINGLLLVQLMGIDTKIKVLSSKCKSYNQKCLFLQRFM